MFFFMSFCLAVFCCVATLVFCFQGPAQAGGGLEEAASWFRIFLGVEIVDDEMAGFSSRNMKDPQHLEQVDW